jgi:hypothetical protein
MKMPELSTFQSVVLAPKVARIVGAKPPHEWTPRDRARLIFLFKQVA